MLDRQGRVLRYLVVLSIQKGGGLRLKAAVKGSWGCNIVGRKATYEKKNPQIPAGFA
jgi:hypothetical protein